MTKEEKAAAKLVKEKEAKEKEAKEKEAKEKEAKEKEAKEKEAKEKEAKKTLVTYEEKANNLYAKIEKGEIDLVPSRLELARLVQEIKTGKIYVQAGFSSFEKYWKSSGMSFTEGYISQYIRYLDFPNLLDSLSIIGPAKANVLLAHGKANDEKELAVAKKLTLVKLKERFVKVETPEEKKAREEKEAGEKAKKEAEKAKKEAEKNNNPSGPGIKQILEGFKDSTDIKALENLQELLNFWWYQFDDRIKALKGKETRPMPERASSAPTSNSGNGTNSGNPLVTITHHNG